MLGSNRPNPLSIICSPLFRAARTRAISEAWESWEVVRLVLPRAPVLGGRFSLDWVERRILVSEDMEEVGQEISSPSMFIGSWPLDVRLLPHIS